MSGLCEDCNQPADPLVHIANPLGDPPYLACQQCAPVMQLAAGQTHNRALLTLIDGLPAAEINPGKTFDMRLTARYYASWLGWAVFPVHHPLDQPGAPHGYACSCGKDSDVIQDRCKSPGKHPMISNGFLGATTDLNQIEEWWGRWPHANIGLPTGHREQGGIGYDVLDIDGPEGWETWQQWKLNNPDTLPAVRYIAFTPGNRRRPAGRHHLIDACGTSNTTRALPGIDLRGDGGYILAPPSRGITGPRYAWITPPEAPAKGEQ